MVHPYIYRKPKTENRKQKTKKNMYYLTINGSTVGPMSATQLFAYPINTDTPVSKDGGEWKPLYSFPELMEMYNRNGHATIVNPEVNSKKILCGVMAIILGGIGVQYFCMGKVGGGFLTILLTIITCGLWEVVTLVQGILMLCMSDADFKRKYLDNPATLPLF